jgi:hypothetical protein
MTRAEFTAALESLARAWTEKDYERAAGFFAEDVRYADPLHYRFSSRADLLAFFQDDGGHPQRTVWHNIVFDEAQQVGTAEYTYEGTHRYHGLVLIKVTDDRFSHWREYQHISTLEWEDFCAGTVFPL